MGTDTYTKNTGSKKKGESEKGAKCEHLDSKDAFKPGARKFDLR